jgi:hypothetical protein
LYSYAENSMYSLQQPLNLPTDIRETSGVTTKANLGLDKWLVSGLSVQRSSDGSSRSGGSNGLADRAAFLSAVALHPVGVGSTFTGFGPFGTRFGTCFGIRSGIFVGASLFNSRTFVGTSFAGIATRLHTVDVHPLGVLGAFTGCHSGPSMTRRVSVLHAEILSVSRRTGTGI